MYETLEMMKELYSDEYSENVYLCIKMYKYTLDPMILATMYVKYFKLSMTLFNAFENQLPHDDICSIILQGLDKSLLTFEEGHDNKFSSYYMLVTRRMLVAEYKKVKQFNNCYDIDEVYDVGKDDDYNFIDDFIKSLKLTKREVKYCKLACCGYSNVDIAKIMKCTRTNIHNIRYNIQKKINVYKMTEAAL